MVQYFNFSLDPTNFVAGPDYTDNGYQLRMGFWVISQYLGSLKDKWDLEMRTGEDVEESFSGEETLGKEE